MSAEELIDDITRQLVIMKNATEHYTTAYRLLDRCRRVLRDMDKENKINASACAAMVAEIEEYKQG